MGSAGKVFVDWGKLLQVIVIIGATVYLAAIEAIPSETVTLVLGGAVGYVFGNGKSVAHGQPPAPLLGRHPAPEIEQVPELLEKAVDARTKRALDEIAVLDQAARDELARALDELRDK